MEKSVYLAGAVRTPIGRFGGTLAEWTAADLGVPVAVESLERAGVKPEQVNESIWGCARQAGGGPNVGRQTDTVRTCLNLCQRLRSIRHAGQVLRRLFWQRRRSCSDEQT